MFGMHAGWTVNMEKSVPKRTNSRQNIKNPDPDRIISLDEEFGIISRKPPSLKKMEKDTGLLEVKKLISTENEDGKNINNSNMIQKFKKE